MAESIVLATIANGASLSGAVSVNAQPSAAGGMALVAMRMPGGWTAASLTFQTDLAGDGTFQNVYDDTGAELTMTVAASRDVHPVPPPRMLYAQSIKVRSGTSGTPVNQAAARTIALVFIQV